MPAKAKANPAVGAVSRNPAVASAASDSSPMPVPKVYPLKSGLIDIGVNLTDNMYKGFYNFSAKSSHESDIDLVVDRAEAMGVVGLIITGGNLEESQHAVELAIAQNKRLRARKKSLTCSSPSDELTTHTNNTQPGLKCFATVGCHPTRTVEMEADMVKYLDGLRSLIAKHSVRNLEVKRKTAAADDGSGLEKEEAKETKSSSADGNNNNHTDDCEGDDAYVVVAIGECGLDYDRLRFTKKEQQLIGFEAQFALADEFKLPMFLHDRNTGDDFKNIMIKHKDVLKRCGGGVVHSFTGSAEHLASLLELDLYIGINGCSMKTAENLDVVKKVPLNRLMLETDGPWCEIKKTHDSYSLLSGSPADLQMNAMFQICKKEKFSMGSLVKSRYEPVQMIEVFEVVYQLHKDNPEVDGDREKLASLVRKNTEAVFPLHVQISA